MIPFEQTFGSMGPASREFELLLGKGLIRHGDNPVHTWCAGNCVAKRNSSDMVKPDKEKSTDRIDVLVASIMGVCRAVLAPPPSDPTLGVIWA